MNKCKDCKHWANEQDYDELVEFWSKWSAGIRKDLALCDKFRMFEGAGNSELALAVAKTEIHYHHTKFYTSPDFGCTEWEVRENKLQEVGE